MNSCFNFCTPSISQPKSFWFINKNYNLGKEIKIKHQKIIGPIVSKARWVHSWVPSFPDQKTNIHKKPNHSIFLRNLLMVFGVFPLLLGKSRPFTFLPAHRHSYASTMESFNLLHFFQPIALVKTECYGSYWFKEVWKVKISIAPAYDGAPEET